MWQSKNLSQVNKTYELCVLVDIYVRQVPLTSQRQNTKKIYIYTYIKRKKKREIYLATFRERIVKMNHVA